MHLCCVWTYFRADTGNRAILTATLPAGIAHSSNGTFCHTHIHTRTCTHTHTHTCTDMQASTQTDRPDFSMLTTYQCFIHLIDFHESFNFLFKSTFLLSSLCSIPVFHKLWLERPLTKAPCCVTWRPPVLHILYLVLHISNRAVQEFTSEPTSEDIAALLCYISLHNKQNYNSDRGELNYPRHRFLLSATWDSWRPGAVIQS